MDWKKLFTFYTDILSNYKNEKDIVSWKHIQELNDLVEAFDDDILAKAFRAYIGFLEMEKLDITVEALKHWINYCYLAK